MIRELKDRVPPREMCEVIIDDPLFADTACVWAETAKGDWRVYPRGCWDWRCECDASEDAITMPAPLFEEVCEVLARGGCFRPSCDLGRFWRVDVVNRVYRDKNYPPSISECFKARSSSAFPDNPAASALGIYLDLFGR